ncbi:MAG: hypothetical protein P8Z79_22490, partial [Sedimentisphaerales bacterium]
GRDALATECAKQSQSAAAQEELSAFEKKEYELLLGTPSAANKANDAQEKTEVEGRRTDDGQKTGVGLRRKTLVCRY